MSRTTTRRGPRLAIIAIVLVLASVAAAWLLRPRDPTTLVTTVTAPVGLPGGVEAAIDLAKDRRVSSLVLNLRFVPSGVGASAPCPESVRDSAEAIKHAGLPVTLLIDISDEQLGDCARGFAAATGQCVVSPRNACLAPAPESRSRLGLLLALLVAAAALTALAWTLLRRSGQRVAAPPPMAPRPPPPPPRPPPPASVSPRPPGPGPGGSEYPPWGHPLAERLRYPQPAEVRSALEPTGFVAFDGGLWRAVWADRSMPPPGIGARILIQYDEREGLVAVPSR
jgi:hypothetical protein